MVSHTGELVPPGGDEGQVLAKASGLDGDTQWQPAPSGASVLLAPFLVEQFAMIPGADNGGSVDWTSVVGDFPSPTWLNGSGQIKLPTGTWHLTSTGHLFTGADATTLLVQQGAQPSVTVAVTAPDFLECVEGTKVIASDGTEVVDVYYQHNDTGPQTVEAYIAIAQIA